MNAAAVLRALPAVAPAGHGAIVRVGGVTIVVRTEAAGVMEWLNHYMSAFWHVDDRVEARAARRPDAVVIATADTDARLRLCAVVDNADPVQRVRLNMGATGRRLISDPYLVAVDDSAPVAYLRRGLRVTVAADAHDLGLAVVRVVRALGGACLEARGFALVHAAAASAAGTGLLAFGDKGAGKTTAVTSLATRRGWAIAAHDRCYVGTMRGRPCALSWPSSLNIGVGLAGALGWTSQLRVRYLRGERAPYHQQPAVTAAVLAGCDAPVHGDGRELKIQLLPSQVTGWFGIELARAATPLAMVFPVTSLSTSRVRLRRLDSAPVTMRDVFPPVDGTDHYPDFLGLHRIPAAERAGRALATLHRLGESVPAFRVELGRDIEANASALASIIDDVDGGRSTKEAATFP